MDIVSEIFQKYSSKLGSDHIAQKSTLREILKLRSENIRTILEIGSGIGTITEFLKLTYPQRKIYGIEKDDWCKSQLAENPELSNVIIFDDVKAFLTQGIKVDFIIIDDYFDQDDTYNLLKESISNLNEVLILIEGHRRIQRLFVYRAFNRLGLKYHTRLYGRGSDSTKGGIVFVVNDNFKNVARFKTFVSIYVGLIISRYPIFRKIVPKSLRVLFNRSKEI